MSLPSPRRSSNEKLTIWPDLEGRIGICTNRKPQSSKEEIPLYTAHELDDGSGRILYEELPDEELCPAAGYSEDLQGLSTLCELYEAHGDVERMLAVADLIEAMGQPSSPKSTKPKRAKRGSGGMTDLGRRMVQSGAAIIERDAPPGCVSFITLTLPSLNEALHDRACTAWSEITRQFCQEIKRELQRAGLSGDYVQVTENQPGRSKREGRFCPHLHLVCQGRSRYSAWAITPAKLTEIAKRVFSSVLGETVSCSASTKIERVEKSVVAYMANYLTKCKSQTPENQEHIPSAWWGCSDTLKKTIKVEIITRFGGIASEIFRNPKIYMAAGIISYYHYVKFEFKGVEKIIGMAFRFKSRQAIQQFMEME